MTNLDFEFRTKTKKAINEQLTDQDKVVLNEYIRDFLENSEYEAFYEILRIKLAPLSVLENNYWLSSTKVTEDVLSKLCGDLIANYKARNPSCWLNEDFNDFSKDFQKAIKYDKTFMYLVRRKVNNRFEAYVDIDRLKFLLMSNLENNRYGGILELGFTKKEATFFKDFASYVWGYIEDNYLLNKKNEKELVPPMVDLNKNEVVHTEEKNNSDSYNQSIQVIDVILNEKLIKDFYSLLNSIEDEGLDPKELVEKRQLIEKLLKISEDF